MSEQPRPTHGPTAVERGLGHDLLVATVQGLATGAPAAAVKVGQIISKPSEPKPEPTQVILPPGVERPE